MQPRLPSSKKWTPLPAELVTQIRTIFTENFAAQTKDGQIETSGRIYPQEILIRVGFKPNKSLRQQNWEISITYNQKKDNVMKLLHLSLDAVGALFEQLFGSENDHEFPREWEEVEFEKKKINIRYTTENTALESEANKLLGINEEAEEAVAQGDWQEEEEIDPEEIKAKLGLVEEDEEEKKH